MRAAEVTGQRAGGHDARLRLRAVMKYGHEPDSSCRVTLQPVARGDDGTDSRFGRRRFLGWPRGRAAGIEITGWQSGVPVSIEDWENWGHIFGFNILL